MPGQDTDRTDEELVRAVVGGDRDAFEMLVRRYERKIYNLALLSTADPHEAYDLGQEVFLRVFRSLSSFRHESKFSTWLFRVAQRMCIDQSRRRKRRPVPLTAVDEGEEARLPAPLGDQPEEQALRRETALTIRREIAHLPPRYREALILRDIQGLTYEEIAAILQMPEGTVKSWIHRGRLALRKRLAALQLLPSTRVEPSRRGEVP